MRLKNPPPLPSDDPRHGTMSGYDYCGCRCQDCRESAARFRKLFPRPRSNGEGLNLAPANMSYDFSEMIPSCDGYNHYQVDYDA